MNIIIDEKIGGCAFGLSNALNSFGHKCVLWFRKDKPAFDIFDETNPDIFIGSKESLDEAVHKCLNEREGLVAKIYDNGYGLLAFDDIIYRKGEYKEDLSCDVLYIGQFSDWKLDYLYPIIEKNLRVKIFSKSYWGIPEHVGSISHDSISDAYATAKISLNLEKEPTDGQYRIYGCGGLCVSNIHENIPLSQIVKTTPKEMQEAILSVINNEQDIEELKKQQEIVREKYTYRKLSQLI